MFFFDKSSKKKSSQIEMKVLNILILGNWVHLYENWRYPGYGGVMLAPTNGGYMQCKEGNFWAKKSSKIGARVYPEVCPAMLQHIKNIAILYVKSFRASQSSWLDYVKKLIFCPKLYFWPKRAT